MCSKPIPIPSLFNTGLLKNSAIFRQKQGLIPQEISNLCSSCTIAEPGFCSINCLHPSYQPHWNYYMPKIPNSCPCVRYVQPY